ncbi:tyrosine-type recombinase/integrase [Agarivorans sp. B2Z047]|uniref:site-specific integrase n=1 Tax=Agarivorans sp. B2Z047 TaxID=2652721 RepID=UPI00128DFE71|nr:site-specific integrase [Agarivorans sp. B2Z047]MPW31617.1 tyrosine-type recombinase/integrase [Agarivorans sp. B2Z047]UQN42423.1 site-specific integrase [Agarivorans sp. B2Z047]
MVVNVEKVRGTKRTKPKSDKRLSKANYEFDVYSDIWQLDANTSLNLGLLNPLHLTPKFAESYRLALADYASEFSSSYVSNIFRACRHLFSFGVTNKVNEQHVINFKSTLTKKMEHKLGGIRAFLLDWHDKNINGVDKKVVELLTSLKLSGNEKGKAVALGCPYSGAYTFEEQIELVSWYVDAFTDKLISLTDYAFIMALQYTGARPIQLANLYYGDLTTRSEAGIEHFDLQIPNAKKRDEPFRGSFKVKQDVSEDLMLVLSTQATQSIKTVEAQLGIRLTPKQKKQIPIFISELDISELSSFSEFEQIQLQTPDLFCIRQRGVSSSVGGMVKRLARLCPLKTTRIKVDGGYGDLHINPRRFRYTHATNMAMLGASAHAIAEELGHEDIQNVTIYTEFNEEMADRIDEALATDLVPLAQAFSGTLIDSEKDAIRANDPRSRINNDSGNPVGNCGTFGFCANGSVHCYTCNKFQPWLNGPHAEMLKSVVSKRDRKREMGASELVLQGHNRSINAIKAVIQKCNARKQELGKERALNV